MSDKETEKQLMIEQGKRLTEARFKLGYSTITQFAKKIEISEATISAIERYERKISRKVFEALGKKLKNLNVEWIRSGEGEMIIKEYKNESRLSIIKDESAKSYQQVCEECRKKDEIIKDLLMEINQVRKEHNDCLKELSGLRKNSG
jgi:transcriptional regulator with XRE-family HTH domain